MTINPISFNNQAQNPFGQAFGNMAQLLSSLDTERLKQALLGTQVKYADPMAQAALEQEQAKAAFAMPMGQANLDHVLAQTGLTNAQIKKIPLDQKLQYMQLVGDAIQRENLLNWRGSPTYQFAQTYGKLPAGLKADFSAQNISGINNLLQGTLGNALASTGTMMQLVAVMPSGDMVPIQSQADIPEGAVNVVNVPVQGMSMGSRLPMSSSQPLFEETSRDLFKTLFGRESAAGQQQQNQLARLTQLFGNQNTENVAGPQLPMAMTPQGSVFSVAPGSQVPFGSQFAPPQENVTGLSSNQTQALPPNLQRLQDTALSEAENKRRPLQQNKQLYFIDAALQLNDEIKPLIPAVSKFAGYKGKLMEFGQEQAQRFGVPQKDLQDFQEYWKRVVADVQEAKRSFGAQATDEASKAFYGTITPDMLNWTPDQITRWLNENEKLLLKMADVNLKSTGGQVENLKNRVQQGASNSSSFPRQLLKGNQKVTVSNESELKEAQAEGWK